MPLNAFKRWSLKSRVTVVTLLIFFVSLWSLSYYASRMLRSDLEQMLGQQQFASVSLIAQELNQELAYRLKALGQVASRAAPSIQDGAAATQTLLDQNALLADLFNFGALAYSQDGTAIAESPFGAGRVGLNYMDNATVAQALAQGKSSFSEVHLGKKLRAPVFGMTVPVRDAQGKVVGALSGVIDLGLPNFLDLVTANRYGQTGGYLLIAPKQRLIITATDKSRHMEQLPARGINPVIDRFLDGYQGTVTGVNGRGVEMMMSDVSIPTTDWIVSAVLPTEEAFSPIRSMQQRLLVATLLLTLLAAALTWVLLRSQLAPMLSTVRTLARLAEENQPPPALTAAYQDEFGDLIKGFNHLLQTLAKREAAVQESAQHYRRLVADLQVGVLIQSPSSQILMSNQLALDLLGLTEDQLLGKTSFDPTWNVIHEDGSPFPGETHPVPQAIATGLPVENVVMGVYRPTTQTRVWLLVTAKPQFESDGRLQQVVCTFSDISKRKWAEAALEKSEAFKTTVLNSLIAEIAVIDSQGVIQTTNQAWQRFALQNRGEPGASTRGLGVGTNYLAVCSADAAAQDLLAHDASQGIQAVLAGRLPSFSLEYPCDSPQEQRWFSMTVVPLGQDVHDGAVVTHTDITALKLATQYELHRSRILELLAQDEPLMHILSALVTGVEQLHLGSLCSVLLLSSDGRRLEHTIAPSLPDFYNTAIDGVEIGPGVGSCGTAAFTGERVIVEDIETHPYWAAYKDLARRAGLGACWSQPFFAASGEVLGTFAIYHAAPHAPQPVDLALIEQSAQLASIAIEKNLVQQRLRDSEAHFRLLTEQVSDVVWRQDRNNVFTYISPADERLRGFRAEEVIGQHVSTLLTAEGMAIVQELRQQRQEADLGGELTQAMTFELQQRCKDGRLVWTEVLSVPERDAQGTITGYHGITRDITGRKQVEEQVRQLAFFDPLTLLPNRRMLDDRLRQTLAASSHTGRFGALIFLDLDNFKPLNDTQGHEVGDLLLTEVAHRLKASVREMDTVVRIGGDEFVMMLSELKTDPAESRLQAGLIAEKVRLALAEPYILTIRHAGFPDKVVTHHCTASLGVALFVNQECGQADLMKRADAAMYQAKDAGRNCVRFCGESISGAV